MFNKRAKREVGGAMARKEEGKRGHASSSGTSPPSALHAITTRSRKPNRCSVRAIKVGRKKKTMNSARKQKCYKKPKGKERGDRQTNQ